MLSPRMATTVAALLEQKKADPDPGQRNVRDPSKHGGKPVGTPLGPKHAIPTQKTPAKATPAKKAAAPKTKPGQLTPAQLTLLNHLAGTPGGKMAADHVPDTVLGKLRRDGLITLDKPLGVNGKPGKQKYVKLTDKGRQRQTQEAGKQFGGDIERARKHWTTPGAVAGLRAQPGEGTDEFARLVAEHPKTQLSPRGMFAIYPANVANPDNKQAKGYTVAPANHLLYFGADWSTAPSLAAAKKLAEQYESWDAIDWTAPGPDQVNQMMAVAQANGDNPKVMLARARVNAGLDKDGKLARELVAHDGKKSSEAYIGEGKKPSLMVGQNPYAKTSQPAEPPAAPAKKTTPAKKAPAKKAAPAKKKTSSPVSPEELAKISTPTRAHNQKWLATEYKLTKVTPADTDEVVAEAVAAADKAAAHPSEYDVKLYGQEAPRYVGYDAAQLVLLRHRGTLTGDDPDIRQAHEASLSWLMVQATPAETNTDLAAVVRMASEADPLASDVAKVGTRKSGWYAAKEAALKQIYQTRLTRSKVAHKLDHAPGGKPAPKSLKPPAADAPQADKVHYAVAALKASRHFTEVEGALDRVLHQQAGWGTPEEAEDVALLKAIAARFGLTISGEKVRPLVASLAIEYRRQYAFPATAGKKPKRGWDQVRGALTEDGTFTEHQVLGQAGEELYDEEGRFLDKVESHGLAYYTWDGYGYINEYLRKDGTYDPSWMSGHASVSEAKLKNDIRLIDDQMAATTTTQETEVFRALKNPVEIWGTAWGDDVTGLEWSEKSYSSTSAVIQEGFANGNGVIMRIRVPKGAHAVQGNESEREILLDRNSRFRVVKDHGTVAYQGTTGDNLVQLRRYLDVELVPPSEPKPKAKPGHENVTEALKTKPIEPKSHLPTGEPMPAGLTPPAKDAPDAEHVEYALHAIRAAGTGEQISDALYRMVGGQDNKWGTGPGSNERLALLEQRLGFTPEDLARYTLVNSMPEWMKATVDPATLGATERRQRLADTYLFTRGLPPSATPKAVRGFEDIRPTITGKAKEFSFGSGGEIGLPYYANEGFVDINEHLRTAEDRANYSPQMRAIMDASAEVQSHYALMQKHIDAIDAEMAKSTTTQPIEVWRAVSDPAKVFGQAWSNSHDVTGLEWSDRAYASTSARILDAFADDDGVVMRLVVPKGTRAVPVVSLEQEIVLDRGLRYRVVADHGTVEYSHNNGTGKKQPRRRRYLDVEVVAGSGTGGGAPALEKKSLDPDPDVRNVASQAGVERYGLPLGAPIGSTTAPDATGATPFDEVKKLAKPGKGRHVSRYAGSGYWSINGYLRGVVDLEPHEEDEAKTLSAALDRDMADSPLTAPVTVWRVVNDPERIFGDAWKQEPGANTGMGWVDRAYTSTTTDLDYAKKFSYGPGVMMRIHVPTGMGAVWIEGQESELLLRRGLEFRVRSDQPGDGDYWKYRFLDVEVVGAHDDNPKTQSNQTVYRWNAIKQVVPPGDRNDPSLGWYVLNGYDYINKRLRGQDNDEYADNDHLYAPNPDDPDFEVDLVDVALDGLEKLFANAGRTIQDVEVFRVVPDPEVVFAEHWGEHDLTGMRWTEDAYLSTSAEKPDLKFLDYKNKGLVMRILLPAGSPAVWIDGLEKEVLGDKGQQLEVVADHGVDEYGRRQLDVVVVKGPTKLN